MSRENVLKDLIGATIIAVEVEVEVDEDHRDECDEDAILEITVEKNGVYYRLDTKFDDMGEVYFTYYIDRRRNDNGK